MSDNRSDFHVVSGTGKAFWDPGDMYTFLVSGEQAGGALFAMEGLAPAGGGPLFTSTKGRTRPSIFWKVDVLSKSESRRWWHPQAIPFSFPEAWCTPLGMTAQRRLG